MARNFSASTWTLTVTLRIMFSSHVSRLHDDPHVLSLLWRTRQTLSEFLRAEKLHLLLQRLPCLRRECAGEPLIVSGRACHNIQRIIDLACVFIVGGVRLNIGVLSFTGQLSAKYLLFIGKDIKLECCRRCSAAQQ